MDTEDLIEKKVNIMILLCIMMLMLAMLPRMVNQVIKICNYKQTASLNVDDKYYQNSRWGNSYKIVINCHDEEKEIAVSEKEFHAIKIGDKVLCNVYRSANQVVTVELNEHWKDAGDKYDN